MPTPFKSMLFYLSEIAKTNNYREPFCPICGERLCITKHGFYRRYSFMVPSRRVFSAIVVATLIALEKHFPASHILFYRLSACLCVP